jgi:hypothetical protein
MTEKQAPRRTVCIRCRKRWAFIGEWLCIQCLADDGIDVDELK